MGILDSFRLDDKIALVTGANRGLGQAMALGLAEAGADVAGLNRSDDDGGTSDQIRALGRQYAHIKLDLAQASTDDVRSAVQAVVTQLGGLHILVNNAGIIRRAPLAEFTETDWDDVLQVNLKAAFFLAQAAAQHMIETEQGGKIINIASMLSYQGGVFVPAYTASKHAIAGATKALANELAPHGINVNGIAPGYMATDNTAPLRADEDRNASILARIPAGRWGDSTDLQGCAVFLASAASDYLQGEIINVDGGWMVR